MDDDSALELPLVADVVEAWAPTGGGIRSYIEAKATLWTRTRRARHLLIVPGARSRVTRRGLRTVVEIRGPRIPGCAPYRFLLSRRGLRDALETFRPDVVELGSQYLAGSTALAYAEAVAAEGAEAVAEAVAAEGGTAGAAASRGRPRISLFFHTDVAGAYVGPVARRFAGSRVGALLESRVKQRLAALGRRVDWTLVSSPAHVEPLRALGLPRLHRLPLGVDLEVFHPASDRAEPWARTPEAPHPSEACQFVFVGRLDNEKRIPLLLEAFRRARSQSRTSGSRSPRLLLVGEGPLAGEVQAAVAAAGTDGAPCWLEHQPFETDRRRLARLLAASDVYLTAGPHETFGLAVLEAQACGLPVLGVRAGALRDRVCEVDPRSGWLVPPDDAEALAAAIHRVAGLSRADRAAVGAAGRAQAVQSGGWEGALSSLAELYGLPAPRPIAVSAPLESRGAGGELVASLPDPDATRNP